MNITQAREKNCNKKKIKKRKLKEGNKKRTLTPQ